MTNNEPTEFHGYSLFKDILNPSIRAWNRANVIYTIKERHGNVVATRYAEHFPKTELTSIYAIMALVAKEGYENIRREVFKEHVNV